MGTRNFKLDQAALREIARREQATRDARELRSLQAVRLYGSGEPVERIRAVSGASERSIRRWVERYEADGIAGLKAGWKGGNHRGLSTGQRAVVGVQLREHTPSAVLGKTEAGAFWTVETVGELLETQYQVVYRSVRSLHAVLEDSGLSYQRPEGIYRSRPSEAVIAEFEAAAEKK
jgi:putative transposase